eukprot:TRINITY_DN4842_c0_g1_i2.p1 TRINITY_DN4842_c0_g1~~TRINITY_DN4842_c0_g1_i2.p1  ORF type:complete len:184 (-),score=49.56 TRINITY_DN4842_c0_g1_i2:3-554(-)
MCELGTEDSDWVTVHTWESQRDCTSLTLEVMRQVHAEINGQVEDEKDWVQVRFLAGSDLLTTVTTPGVWDEDALREMLGQYGTIVTRRFGTEARNIFDESDLLKEYEYNVWLYEDPVYNDLSSTKLRKFCKTGQSLKYLTPDPVIDYIKEQGLYLEKKVSVAELESEDSCDVRKVESSSINQD